MRIEGVSGKKAGPFTRLLLWFGRRETSKLTGRATSTEMIEPATAFANAPGLLLGYGIFERAVARAHRVEERLKVLAELKAAAFTHCEWCIDIASPIARRAGISDEQMLALPHYRESALFDERERLVLDYAVGISSTPVCVSDELFAQLREHFDDAQLVELTNVIAVENMRGRFNLALGIGTAGFAEGMVCIAPELPPEREAPGAGAR
jgi:AhpD family alkylhydroperoxidase